MSKIFAVVVLNPSTRGAGNFASASVRFTDTWTGQDYTSSIQRMPADRETIVFQVPDTVRNGLVRVIYVRNDGQLAAGMGSGLFIPTDGQTYVWDAATGIITNQGQAATSPLPNIPPPVVTPPSPGGPDLSFLKNPAAVIGIGIGVYFLFLRKRIRR